ncbi:histidine--tRNA ligase [Caedimonas varicaedens]|uniref:Histidine--tRNA ligase n=1 Tax=Caedimonas varicaedens TaxID=1629334 RepID=A0A0K8MG52_9PROT|nr:histidine--tRNA ligase [Caedimonas varicaedens]
MFQPVRGTHDLYGEECQKHLKVIETAREITQWYGYDEIITPIFEFEGVFHRLGETSDVVSKETYTFTDRGGDSLTLRPECTAPVVRAAISNGLTQQLPLKFFYAGSMFRYDRPQKGRFRQFEQVGVELCGVSEPQGDVEVIALAAHILERLGLSGRVILEINTLGDMESRNAYREALVSYFKRYTSSLSKESLERLEKNPLRILDSKDKKDQEIVREAPVFNEFLSHLSKAHFEDVLKSLELLKISYKINRKLVRGLDYYCHTAFEFISDELGAQGTVLAGGRYDGLFKMMEGPDLSGVGWAAGVQRLMLLSHLTLAQKSLVALVPLGEVAEAQALILAQQLRKQGIAVDLGFSGNMSKRLKRAHKMEAQWAIILGEDEIREHVALARNLVSGEQTKIPLSQLAEYLLVERSPS